MKLFLKFILFISALLLTISCGKKKETPSQKGGTATTPPTTPQRTITRAYLWVTSTLYGGNDMKLRSDASADAECAARAATTDLSLPAGVSVMVHKAVLARTGFHPRDIFTNGIPVYRQDNSTNISNSYQNFLSAAVSLATPVTGTILQYWTGLNNGGTIGNTCNNWTDNSAGINGNFGNGFRDDPRRFGDGGAGLPCSISNRILCLSY